MCAVNIGSKLYLKYNVRAVICLYLEYSVLTPRRLGMWLQLAFTHELLYKWQFHYAVNDSGYYSFWRSVLAG